MRRVIAVILSFAATGAYWQAGAQTKTSGTDGFQFVDKTGNIRKPTNVRDTYQSLGAVTVLDPKGNSRHSGSVSPHRQISRWNCLGEGSVRNRARANDHRRRKLGVGTKL
jgi:hypothetical protein